MRDCNQGRFRQQVRFLRRQFLQDGDFPFCNILSEQIVSKALTAIEACWLDRIYSPLITLWVFLGQVLSQDHSCRAAVARLIAHRVSRGQRPCSAETGAYCQARKRLPEEFVSEVARQTGRALETSAEERWLWKCRRVLVYDGSTVSMPDTPENQQSYPQPPQQKPGVVFLWHALRFSFLFRAEQSLIWQCVVMQARGTASWECSASYGTSCFPGMSCLPTGICVRGAKSSCSGNAESIL